MSITWRNVTAANNANASRLAQLGQDQITGAFSSFADTLGKRMDDASSKEQGDLLLRQVFDSAETDAERESIIGLAGSGASGAERSAFAEAFTKNKQIQQEAAALEAQRLIENQQEADKLTNAYKIAQIDNTSREDIAGAKIRSNEKISGNELDVEKRISQDKIKSRNRNADSANARAGFISAADNTTRLLAAGINKDGSYIKGREPKSKAGTGRLKVFDKLAEGMIANSASDVSPETKAQIRRAATLLSQNPNAKPEDFTTTIHNNIDFDRSWLPYDHDNIDPLEKGDLSDQELVDLFLKSGGSGSMSPSEEAARKQAGFK